jgi:hypothetical protein
LEQVVDLISLISLALKILHGVEMTDFRSGGGEEMIFENQSEMQHSHKSFWEVRRTEDRNLQAKNRSVAECSLGHYGRYEQLHESRTVRNRVRLFQAAAFCWRDR